MVKHEFNEVQAHIDAQVEANESALAMVSTFEVQILTDRTNDSTRENMIARFESELSKATIEMVNAQVEAVMSSIRAYQKVAAYLRSCATAKAEVRRTLGCPRSSIKYAKC